MKVRWLIAAVVVVGGCTQANPAFDEPSDAASSSTGVVGSTTSPTGDPGTTTTTAAASSSSSGGVTSMPVSTGSTGTSDPPATSGASSTTSADTDGCEPPETLCGGECVNTATDRAHCGVCDRVCPGNQQCVDADCQGGPGGG